MHNLENRVPKFALYGMDSSLGAALVYQILTHQYEVVALVDDLNALVARPGLRAKLGDPRDETSVSQAVAGCDAVIYVHAGRRNGHDDFPKALDGLLGGLGEGRVKRLVIVADVAELMHEPDYAATMQRLADDTLQWTLVDVSGDGFDLGLDDFLAPAKDRRRQTLLREAAAIVDELRTPQHIHERVRFSLH